MKIYSIFLKEKSGNALPILEDKMGDYWLGGYRLYPLIFTSKKEAARALKRVKLIVKNEHPPRSAMNSGKIFVSRADIKPL